MSRAAALLSCLVSDWTTSDTRTVMDEREPSGELATHATAAGLVSPVGMPGPDNAPNRTSVRQGLTKRRGATAQRRSNPDAIQKAASAGGRPWQRTERGTDRGCVEVAWVVLVSVIGAVVLTSLWPLRFFGGATWEAAERDRKRRLRRMERAKARLSAKRAARARARRRRWEL